MLHITYYTGHLSNEGQKYHYCLLGLTENNFIEGFPPRIFVKISSNILMSLLGELIRGGFVDVNVDVSDIWQVTFKSFRKLRCPSIFKIIGTILKCSLFKKRQKNCLAEIDDSNFWD